MPVIHDPDHHRRDLAVPAPTATVYSVYWPRVRAVCADAMRTFDHDELDRNIVPGLDDAHARFIDMLAAGLDDAGVRGLSALSFTRPTGGSSEALFHLIARHAAEAPGSPLLALEGDYQGYAAYAEACNVALETADPEALLARAPGTLILSQPSARDGMRLPADLLSALIDRHRTIVDVAYWGLVDDLGVDAAHPNVEAVVASLSKPYGLYYYRAGAVWSRRPVASLVGNQWFKSLPALRIGEAVMDAVAIADIAAQARQWQREALRQVERELALEPGYLQPCDIPLLGTSAPHPALTDFMRHGRVRLCVSRYLQVYANR